MSIEALRDQAKRDQAKIFLSYVQEDHDRVFALHGALRDSGFEPWMFEKDQEFVPDYRPVLEQKIQESRFFLACLSANTAETTQGPYIFERNVALEWSRNYQFDDAFIVVVLLDHGCAVPPELRFHHREQEALFANERLSSNALSRLIEQLDRKLRRPGTDTGPEPRARWPEMNLAGASFPEVELRSPPERALHRYFIDSVREGNITEAKGALEGCTNYPWSRQLLDLLRWVQWYDDETQRAESWKSLSRTLPPELESQLAAPSAPSALRGVCAPVAQALTQAFWSEFNRCLEKFKDYMIVHRSEGLGAMAARFTALFDRLLADDISLTRAVEHAEELASDAGLLPTAKMAFSDPASLDPTEQPQALFNSAFPPKRDAIVRIERDLDQRKKQAAAAKKLRELLQAAAGRAAQGQLVVEQLDAVCMLAGDPQATPDLTRARPLAEVWRVGLASNLGSLAKGAAHAASDGDEGVMAHWVGPLQQAAALFPRAREQADMFREFIEGRDRYTEWLKRLHSTWDGSSVDLDRFANAVEGLERFLPRIRTEYTDWTDYDTLDKAEERLKAASLECTNVREMLGPLSRLRGGDAAAALHLLQEVTRRNRSAGPWLDAAAIIAALVENLAGLRPLWNTGDLAGLGPADIEGLLNLPDNEFDEGWARVSEALNKVRAAREQDQVFKAFSVPGIEALRNHLETLRTIRTTWQNSRNRLAATDFQGASAQFELLARDLPSARGAHALVESWARHEQKHGKWKDDLEQAQWDRAAAGIEALEKVYATGPPEPGGLGIALAAEAGRRRLQELRELRSVYECASTAEAELKTSLGRMESEPAQVLASLTFLEQQRLPEVLLNDVALWRSVAEALTDLRARIDQNDSIDALEPNSKTGLPPEEETLRNERQRLASIRSAANKALDRRKQATAGSRFPCSVDLPERMLEGLEAADRTVSYLGGYADCVREVKASIEEGEWAKALGGLEKYDSDLSGLRLPPTNIEAGYMRLLATVRLGCELRKLPAAERLRLGRLQVEDLSHPFLAHFRQEREELEKNIGGAERARLSGLIEAAGRICSQVSGAHAESWLLTPLLEDPAALERLKARVEELRRDFEESQSTPKERSRRPGNPKRGIQSLLQAAGKNAQALFASAGEMETVFAEAKTHRSRLPHNAVVAVLSRIQQGSQPTGAGIPVAIGSAALFAFSGDYRNALAEGLQGALPADLSGEGRLAPSRIRGQLQQIVSAAGIAWGRPDEANSLACLWEIECFAVSHLAAKGYDPLPWPFGPSLVRFYGLETDLGEVLKRLPELRIWYGPAAAGVALLWSEQPRAALAALATVPGLTEREVKESPGYVLLADSRNALMHDAHLARSDAWFYLLNRSQFTAETTVENQPDAQATMVQCCRELLDLRALGVDLSGRLTETLRRIFARMVEQVQKPKIYLGRRATSADAEMRRVCMDHILDVFTEAQARPGSASWLSSCVGALRAKRSELIVWLLDLKCSEWRNTPQGAELEEIDRLSEQAVADAPGDPFAKVVRFEVQMVIALSRYGKQGLARFEPQLKELMNKAVAHHWPAHAIETINSLVQFTGDVDEFSLWMRDRMLGAQQNDSARRSRREVNDE